MKEEFEESLCDKEDCKEVARYIQTGDGKALKNPKRRCHKHKSDSGFWRDFRAGYLSFLRGDD